MSTTAIAPGFHISSILSTLRSASPVRASFADAPAPDPDPTPGLDLSTIDTPEKAAVLPALNAPILSMLYGSLNPGATLMAADFSLQLGLGNNPSNVHYAVNAPDGTFLRGVGTLAGQAFSETWRPAADGGFDVNGQIGTSVENLHIHADTKYWYMDGQVGSVAVHQKGFVVVSPSDGSARYILDGTLGDEDFHSELYRMRNGVEVDGYVGGEGTSGTITTTANAGNGTLLVSGGGGVADVAFAFSGTLTLAPPSAPTPPTAVGIR